MSMTATSDYSEAWMPWFCSTANISDWKFSGVVHLATSYSLECWAYSKKEWTLRCDLGDESQLDQWPNSQWSHLKSAHPEPIRHNVLREAISMGSSCYSNWWLFAFRIHFNTQIKPNHRWNHQQWFDTRWLLELSPLPNGTMAQKPSIVMYTLLRISVEISEQCYT